MKLTVAIPAYKRPEFLERCIASVLAAASGRDVEILIMDDSMDDTNSQALARFAGEPNVRVVPNERNLGIDANICACVENARGDYVWLIGEDDLMRRGAIDSLFPLLDKNYPFVFVNYSYVTDDHRLMFRDRSVEIHGTSIPFDSFYDEWLWSAGFIGACVVHRAEFLATAYRDFIGTYYAHVAGLSLASRGKTIGLVCEPQVGNRVGDASAFTWSSDSFSVFQGWRTLLGRLKPAFGEPHYARAYASHKQAHGYLGWKFLVIKQADGLLRWSDVKRLLADETSMAERMHVVVAFALIPRPLARLMRTAYGRLRRFSLKPFALE